jgi:hypothetical protein
VKIFRSLWDTNTARAVVLAIFLISYAVGLGRLLWGWHPAGYSATMQTYLDLFFKIYSVPFSIVLVGVLARKPRAVMMDPMKFALLYLATLIWNGFIVYGIYSYFGSFASSTTDLTATLTLVKDELAFLITGILAYVYATDGSANQPVGDGGGAGGREGTSGAGAHA